MSGELGVVADLYPPLEPFASGRLDVGDGNELHWEACGTPAGKPAVVLHGGPGSGCTPGWRRFFDPARYHAVLFDQRGCGRSTPHAGDPATSLDANTTQHLVADVERLRAHLGIERWLVLGASWGTTLALAYAERHPDRVTEMVLFLVATTTRREVQWVTRDMGRVFPEQWARFRDGVPPAERDGDLAAAYSRLLEGGAPAAREQAARDWCRWEDVHVRLRAGARPSARYADPVFRLAFARLVTHYWGNAAFLPDGQLLREVGALASVPGVLIHGRLDVSSPLDTAWHLSRAWPGSELVVVDEAGHSSGDPGMSEAVVGALARYAGR